MLVNTSGGSSGASSQRLPDDEGSSVNADFERRVTDLGNKTADHEVLIVEIIVYRWNQVEKRQILEDSLTMCRQRLVN